MMSNLSTGCILKSLREQNELICGELKIGELNTDDCLTLIIQLYMKGLPFTKVTIFLLGRAALASMNAAVGQR